MEHDDTLRGDGLGPPLSKLEPKYNVLGAFTLAFCTVLVLVLPGCFDLTRSDFSDAGSDASPHVDDGELRWAKQAGGVGDEEVFCVRILPSGGVLVGGNFRGKATFGAGEPCETTLTDIYGEEDWWSDGFVARYSWVDGSLDWVKQIGSLSWVRVHDILVQPDASAVALGVFDSSAEFWSSDDNSTLLEHLDANPSSDLFIVGFEEDGTLRWAKSAGGSGSDRALAAASLDVSSGSFVVVGRCSDQAVFGPEEALETVLTNDTTNCIPNEHGTAFAARYDGEGLLEWARGAEGCGASRAVGSYSSGFLVAGSYEGTIVFGTGEDSETTLSSLGDENRNLFVASYGSDGKLYWARGAGAAGEDVAVAISVLNDGSAIIAGSFEGTIVLGDGMSQQSITAAGAADVLVAHFLADGNLGWVRQAGGLGQDNATSLELLEDGGFLLTGSFEDIATFGPGEAAETTLTATGEANAFVARYTTGGGLVWARHEGRSERISQILGVSANAAGTSFAAAGTFEGQSVLGFGEPHQQSLESVGNRDLFVARFDLE